MWNTSLLVAWLAFLSHATAADALDNLNADRLEAVRQAVHSLRDQRVALARTGPFQEHRANLHVHSHWSHDSQGTIDEIVAAAGAIGTSVLMFTEHPADHYDFFLQGHQGIQDGVLLIPGAEMKGFLAWPTMSLRGVTPASPQELADLIRGRDGQKLKEGRAAGEILLSLFLDRYETSLQHVATHLLLTELSELAVRECLDAGRAFVAFDWIADSTGFAFVAVSETERHPMGSQITLSPGTVIEAHAPLPVQWKLIRNGEVVSETTGRAISVEIQ